MLSSKLKVSKNLKVSP